MDRKAENRMAWSFFVAFIAVIVLSLIFGCKTKTILQTDVVTIHDTLVTYRTDTIRDVKVTTKTDTIKQIESHTFTLNNVGDTIKEIHHYHDLWHTLVVDSTNRYEARMDSLERALEVEKAKNTVVVKRYPIPWWLIAVFGIIISTLYIIVLKSRKK